MEKEIEINNNDGFSIIDVVQKIKSVFKFLRRNIFKLACFCFVGLILGIGYSLWRKPIYNAETTFVLGDQKASFGAYSGLASLVGMDVGNMSLGIFQGDNILELYKSKTMIRKALLSPVKVGRRRELLIDQFIRVNKLNATWKEKPNLQNLSFDKNQKEFTRVHDSIITQVTNIIRKEYLKVGKIDKKLGIIKVNVLAPDEQFAFNFSKEIVQTVNNFYSETRTQKSDENLRILIFQADSVKRVLNQSLGGVANAIDANPNANQAILSLRVPSQRRQVDVQASTAVYAEIVKNLEMAKITARQERPLIQLVDYPIYPLPKDRVGKFKGGIIGIMLLGIIGIATLGLAEILKNMRNDS